MELTLKRMLEDAEFKKYRGKGYDPAEVDEFLAKAAAMAGKVEVQLTQALEKAQNADGTDVEAEVQRRLQEQLAQNAANAPSEEEVAEEARRTLTMAQRTADAAIKEAREDAAAIVAQAEEKAALLNEEASTASQRAKESAQADAEKDRLEARSRLASEIGELEGTRERLRSDVNILERHVEEQRSQLASTVTELQTILDDPSGFRMAPVPTLANPDLPDFSDLQSGQGETPSVQDPEDGVVDTEPETDEESEAGEGQEAVDESASEPAAQLDLQPEADVDTGSNEEPAAAPDPEPLPISLDEVVDHEEPGVIDPGPPTEPVSAVEIEQSDDDPFLAELRKAISDEEPLGPRDEVLAPSNDALFEDEDRRGWRFGRRG